MEIIDTQKQLCVCCMEEHEVQTVIVQETNTFKGVKVEYLAKYFYCDNADEYFSNECMSTENDIAMKNAYRKAVGLLISDEISAIRCR